MPPPAQAGPRRSRLDLRRPRTGRAARRSRGRRDMRGRAGHRGGPGTGGEPAGGRRPSGLGHMGPVRAPRRPGPREPVRASRRDLAPAPGVHSTRVRPIMELFSGAQKPSTRRLQVDGRMSLRDLAKRLGRSEPAVRRRLDHLTRSGMLTFRTGFVRFTGGWRLYVALPAGARRTALRGGPGHRPMAGDPDMRRRGRVGEAPCRDRSAGRRERRPRQFRSFLGKTYSSRSRPAATAAGMATSAPMMPRSAPPTRTARTVTKGWTSTANFMALGTMR